MNSQTNPSTSSFHPTHAFRREPVTMDPIRFHHLVGDRHASLRAEAAAERLARDARRSRGHPADEVDPIELRRADPRRFRAAVGRALIGLGTMIAAGSPGDASNADAGVGHA
jgi:hypothetical protein